MYYTGFEFLGILYSQDIFRFYHLKREFLSPGIFYYKIYILKKKNRKDLRITTASNKS